MLKKINVAVRVEVDSFSVLTAPLVYSQNFYKSEGGFFLPVLRPVLVSAP